MGMISRYLHNITNVCTKFENPKFSSSREIFDKKKKVYTQTHTNIVTEKSKTIYPLYTSYTGDIVMLTKLLYYTKCQSQKREKSQPNINRILPKVNQVIYTFDTICVSNIMILAQAFLQILCWQGPLWVKCQSLKRGTIQSNIHRIWRKVNQVIYIMYLNCMIDAIILAQAVLQIFCWQYCFTVRNAKGGKGR